MKKEKTVSFDTQQFGDALALYVSPDFSLFVVCASFSLNQSVLVEVVKETLKTKARQVQKVNDEAQAGKVFSLTRKEIMQALSHYMHCRQQKRYVIKKILTEIPEKMHIRLARASAGNKHVFDGALIL